MKPKQLMILMALGLVLGVAGYLVRSGKDSEYRGSNGTMGSKVLGDFDANAIVTVRIKTGTNSPVEVTKDKDDWIVKGRGGYPANFQAVGEFIKKLWELDIKNPIKAGPSRLPILELTPETGTLVELVDASGKAVKSLLLGKKHSRESPGDAGPMGGGGFPDGRYVKAGELIALVGDPISTADNKPQDWISKDFFKVEKPIAVKVDHLVASNSFSIKRDNEFGDWKLENAAPHEKLDSSKVSGFSSVLSWPSFNDVILDKKPAELGLDKPTTAAIVTSDGFRYALKIGKADGDNLPLQVNVTAELAKERTPGKEEKKEDKLDKLKEKLKNEQALAKWTYQVSKWTVDALVKERSALFADAKGDDKNPDAGAGAPPGKPGAPFTIPSLPPLLDDAKDEKPAPAKPK